MNTEIYLYAFKFFTTWVLILIIFHKYIHNYINLLYLSFITLICGLYLSFINPRKFVFYFDGKKYIYNGIEKFIIVDMFFHILVFYFVYTHYNIYYRTSGYDVKLIWALLIILLYVIFTNIKKIYGISFWEMGLVFVIANILYYLIFML